MSSFILPHNHGDYDNLSDIKIKLDYTEEFRDMALIFRELHDATRLKIFWMLCHCEECVINISAMLEMSSPAIAHHLRSLKERGLIISQRKGKEVYYTAAKTPQVNLLHEIIERYMSIACPQF